MFRIDLLFKQGTLESMASPSSSNFHRIITVYVCHINFVFILVVCELSQAVVPFSLHVLQFLSHLPIPGSFLATGCSFFSVFLAV